MKKLYIIPVCNVIPCPADIVTASPGSFEGNPSTDLGGPSEESVGEEDYLAPTRYRRIDW